MPAPAGLGEDDSSHLKVSQGRNQQLSIYQGRALRDAPVRVIFCDHDRVHVTKHMHIIKQIWSVAGGGHSLELQHFYTGKQLLKGLGSCRVRPTIIISEADLPDFEGLDAKRKIRKKGFECQLIIYTKDDAYTLEGYEVDATAYLIKDQTTPQQFTHVFMRALEKTIAHTRKYVTFMCGGYQEAVLISDISFFEVNNKTVTVHHNNKTFNFYSSLERVEKALWDYGFRRIHRKFVVSLQHIAHLNTETLTLDCGIRLPIGRSFRNDMANVLRSISVVTLQ